ncbi:MULTISPECIES: monovalent cation/H+ antiporter complex subunit F [Actinoalloteichus]|uniref:Multisubunit Na+/H+ antiporter, MnhF subunit n=1 Tax=Actinoalloteichus fjordicus TaxID=1612552 RepID=A0AAC9LGH9_9PSEU|nr:MULTISPECIES: monovalent cation/H+ antiporter complex subunit F [Actinoalloteichus]APU15854.1 multisubunit Na+/H+ antiporter, MnhF subunit [Actinoalloteichus fjordicus]APU21916.1 multisubunit Na+/H+ antiporter, MnhF subunit [Actinoalloteichus sp. GBA129-24]
MTVIDIGLGAVVLAMIIATYRILRGPSSADRAAGADVIFFGFVGLVALLGLRLETELVIDIVLACTLVGFLAALSLARLIAGGKR